MKYKYLNLIFYFIFLCLFSCDNNKIIIHKIKIENDKNIKVDVSLLEIGQNVYNLKCAICHGIEGVGIGKDFPPLANTDYVKNSTYEELYSIITKGMIGKIYVNNIEYDGVMPPIYLSEQETKSVIEYVKSLNYE